MDFNPATTAHSGDTSIDSGVSRDWSGGSTEFDAGTSTSASGGSASVAAAYEFNPPEKLESFDFSEKKMRLGGENGGRTGKSFYCNCQPVLLFITNPIFSALKASDDNRALGFRNLLKSFGLDVLRSLIPRQSSSLELSHLLFSFSLLLMQMSASKVRGVLETLLVTPLHSEMLSLPLMLCNLSSSTLYNQRVHLYSITAYGLFQTFAVESLNLRSVKSNRPFQCLLKS